MTVTAISAAVSSFAGLQSLAVAAGWPVPLSPLVPFTIDAYAMTATRVWLSGSTGSARARRFARWNAVMAIGLSLVGNAVWHLMAAHVLAVTWPIVVLVGAVPPAVLGLLTHLAVLRGQADAVPASLPRSVESVSVALPMHEPDVVGVSKLARLDQDEQEDGPEDNSGTTDEPRSERPQTQEHVEPSEEDSLLAAAHAAAEAHRVLHGKPITRDELRKTLRVSTERATSLLREIKNISNNR